MNRFSNIDEAISWLYSHKRRVRPANLNYFKDILDELKIDINSYKIIHIAGTNGKGSTATYLSNILQRAGLRVGLYISPYVVCFNERIQINGNYISDNDFLNIVNELKDYIDNLEIALGFFEILTLVMFKYFSTCNLDVAVIECGIGGLLDVTNVVNPIASVITSVGLDHQGILGNTKEEIALQKLGIIKPMRSFYTVSDEELDLLYIQAATRVFAPYTLIDPKQINIKVDRNGTSFTLDGISYHTNLIGTYQATNAALAVKVTKDLFGVPDNLINAALGSTNFQCRMQFLANNLVLDGAHNISAMIELVKNLKQLSLNKKVVCLYSALIDKDYPKMLKELDKIVERYIFYNLDDERKTNPEEFKKYTTKESTVAVSFVEAYNSLADDELMLVTGSLHFVSHILNCFKK